MGMRFFKRPSKKVIVFGVATLILICVLIAIEFRNKSQEYVAQNNLYNQDQLKSAFAKQLNEKDSDNDGLKDWEESLWGTDPHNPDTDGDGTPDGEEVKEGRNPTKKGPDDKLESASTATSTNTSSSDPLTLTGSVSQQFISDYLTLKASGVPITDDLKTSLINGLVKKSLSQPLDIKLYTEADFKTIDQTPENLVDYGHAIDKIFYAHPAPKDGDNEFLILSRAMFNQNKDELKKMDPIISGYDAIISDMSTLPVPSGALKYHVALMNSLLEVSTNIKQMRTAMDDPITGIVSMQRYETVGNYLSTAYAALSTYINDHLQ